MNATTIAVDTAKLVFEVAENQAMGRVKRSRLSRSKFQQFVATRERARFVMEACGGAHHWARLMQRSGHEVRLLPVPYVCRYRLRNKTDRADCDALFEADRNPKILPVPVKSEQAQAIQGLHRLRSTWMASRTARINTLRGLLREFGVILPLGASAALKQMPEALGSEAIPPVLKPGLHEMFAEVRQLEGRIVEVERQLGAIARDNETIERLRQISGIGLLTATALYASAGDAKHFKSGRHLAAWLGLTPREYSSGEVRRLGGISKRGDRYVRMLLTHGARSMLLHAGRKQRVGQELNYLERWALQLKARSNHNKATCALANKLARIAWATWRYGRDFDPNHAAVAA